MKILILAIMIIGVIENAEAQSIPSRTNCINIEKMGKWVDRCENDEVICYLSTHDKIMQCKFK